MKKILLMICFAAAATHCLAQYQTSRERSRYSRTTTERYYGLRLGLNISTVNSDVVDTDLDSRTGLTVGGVYGIQLANSYPIWLELGLLYSEKGGKRYHQGAEITTRLTYLQLPVVIKYSFDVLDDLYIQPFLGGYLAYGVGGKTKNYGSVINNIERESHSSFNDFRRFDGGLRVGCGAEYKMLYAEIGFDFGLANIVKDDFTTARNQNFFMAIGVNF
ncbi:MAG: PorT family protein [Prevotella sp.]|nr:PorT family protein [Prevotella sp.]